MKRGIAFDEIVVKKVYNGAVAGTSEVDSDIIDMAGADGHFSAVAFLIDFGTIVDGSVITATPQENALNQTSGMVATSTAATNPVTAATGSNKQILTDTYCPGQRYVRLALTRTAQNAVVNSITAFLYCPRFLPVTQPSSMLAYAIGQSKSP